MQYTLAFYILLLLFHFINSKNDDHQLYLFYVWLCFEFIMDNFEGSIKILLVAS